jgi:hypothetical protein
MSYKTRKCDGVHFFRKIATQFINKLEINLQDLTKQEVIRELEELQILVDR